MSSWVFRVRGYAVREFGVSGTGFLVICSGFRGQGARFGVFMVGGFGYGVSRFGVSGFGVLQVRVPSTEFQVRGF